MLGPLVELASDLDSSNIEVPGVKTADNNHLREITHGYIDGNPTCLYDTPKSTIVFIGESSFQNVLILFIIRQWIKSKKTIFQIITRHCQKPSDFTPLEVFSPL
jgi:hypothetical protein